MNSLLMTAENGQKTFDGIKTQTRRMLSAFDQTVLNGMAGDPADPSPLVFQFVRDQARQDDTGETYRYTGFLVWLEEYPDEGAIEVSCPFRVGERRYIREPHYLYGRWKRDGNTKTGKPKYRFVADRARGVRYPDAPPCCVCTRKSQVGWFRRPGFFMFEWDARSIVQITEVRIQRVQEIVQLDALHEGCDGPDHRVNFKTLWDSPAIHGPGAWDRNDWVAAVTYKKVRG